MKSYRNSIGAQFHIKPREDTNGYWVEIVAPNGSVVEIKKNGYKFFSDIDEAETWLNQYIDRSERNVIK